MVDNPRLFLKGLERNYSITHGELVSHGFSNKQDSDKNAGEKKRNKNVEGCTAVG